MAKLIQICASRNDLFGLDGEGLVYQYNFSSNTWMELGREWGDHGAPPLATDQTAAELRAGAAPRRRA